MNLNASIQIAIRSLLMNKMRALLTMLGIIIGIGSVIAILTVGNSLTGSINTSLSTFGANNITVALQQRGKTHTFAGPPGLSEQTSTLKPTAKDLITPAMIDAMRRRFREQRRGSRSPIAVGLGQGACRARLRQRLAAGGERRLRPGQQRDAAARPVRQRRRRQGAAQRRRGLRPTGERPCSVATRRGHRAGGQALRSDRSIYAFTVVGVYEYEQSALTVQQVAEKDITTVGLHPGLHGPAAHLQHRGLRQSLMVTAPGVDPIAFADQLQDLLLALLREEQRLHRHPPPRCSRSPNRSTP